MTEEHRYFTKTTPELVIFRPEKGLENLEEQPSLLLTEYYAMCFSLEHMGNHSKPYCCGLFALLVSPMARANLMNLSIVGEESTGGLHSIAVPQVSVTVTVTDQREGRMMCVNLP